METNRFKTNQLAALTYLSSPLFGKNLSNVFESPIKKNPKEIMPIPAAKNNPKTTLEKYKNSPQLASHSVNLSTIVRLHKYRASRIPTKRFR